MTRNSDSRPRAMVRPARRADVRTLTNLIRSYYAFDGIPFDEKAIRAGLRELLQNESAGMAFLMMLVSKPVGYAILTYGFDLEFGGRVALITDLYVEPKHRGSGIGKTTMQFLQQFCRDSGVGAIELQVLRGNKRALSFYRRMGFVAHERIPMSKQLAGTSQIR